MIAAGGRLRIMVAAAISAALSACVASDGGSGNSGVRGPSQTARAPAIPPQSVRPFRTNPRTPTTGFRPAPVMNVPGLDGVIGQNADALQRVFGPPRLNVVEGDVRKLQFSGEACVLDVYLYPPRPGGEPQATYIDARRASDGFDVDRAACANALKR